MVEQGKHATETQKAVEEAMKTHRGAQMRAVVIVAVIVVLGVLGFSAARAVSIHNYMEQEHRMVPLP